MKILEVTSLGYEHGGVENGMVLLRPILTSMGHTVKVLTSDLRKDLPHFNDFEFKSFEDKPILLKAIYRCFYPESYFALKKILKEYHPDIVQIRTLAQISPSILFLLKEYPTVVTVHQGEDFTHDLLLWSFPANFFKNDIRRVNDLNIKGWLHYIYHRYLNSAFYYFGFKNVDQFVVFSRYMQLELEKDNIKSVVIPNSTELFDYVPIDPRGRQIGYVGRLEDVKGVAHLIESFSEIKKEYPDARLLIAGTGKDKASFQNLAKKLGVEKQINFLGQQSRSQLYDLYKNSAVIVVPSVWPEPFGKVGIEAMSVGRPVIGSNVGGIPEWLIDGKVGYLVPPGDSHAITAKVAKLFSNQKLLQDMSQNAREHSQNFDIHRHAEKLIELYERLIHQHKK